MNIVMRSYFILFFFFIDVSTITACQWKETRYVTSFNGISIRSKPDVNSEKIGAVPYWEKVLICGQNQPESEEHFINRVSGKWALIRYENIEGYVYDAYLANVITDDKDDPDYRILTEHNGCGGNNFDPELNWYGVYNNKEGDCFLKPVNINQEKRSSDYGIPVYTDLEEESLFLFATKKELSHDFAGRMNVEENQLNRENNFLYPGQYTSVWIDDYRSNSTRNRLRLDAIGTVEELQYHKPKFKNYQLRASDYYERPRKFQDLIPDFSDLEAYDKVELFWFGNLNGDEIADILFVVKRDQKSFYTLFISDLRENKRYRRVASHFEGPCPSY